jgi:hypothetical protein
MIDEKTLQQRMQRIAELVSHLDSEAGAAVKAQSRELLQAVMDLHGEALERILQRVRETGEAGEKVLDSLGADPVVASVLLLYGLHPLDFETRVRQALDRAMGKLRHTLHSSKTDAELNGLEGGAIRIRLRGVDDASTARTVKSAIEEELSAAAPDAASLVLLGLEKFAPPDFVPLEKLEGPWQPNLHIHP